MLRNIGQDSIRNYVREFSDFSCESGCENIRAEVSYSCSCELQLEEGTENTFLQGTSSDTDMELMDGPLLLEEHFNDNVPFNGASYNTLLSTSSTQKETSYHHRRQDKKLKYNAVIQRIKKLTVSINEK